MKRRVDKKALAKKNLANQVIHAKEQLRKHDLVLAELIPGDIDRLMEFDSTYLTKLKSMCNVATSLFAASKRKPLESHEYSDDAALDVLG